MPLIFPSNPTPNQTYQSGSSATYRWNGVYWVTDTAPTATVITATSASLSTSASFANTGSSVNPLNQRVVISGSLTVFTGSGVELQVTNTGVDIGNITGDRHNITGSVNISGSLLINGVSVSTGVPIWTSTGPIVFGATTTAPVTGSTARNDLFYRQVGPKQWEINLTFDKPIAGAPSIGNGDYLFTLPTACPDFDLALSSTQIFYQGGIGVNDVIFNRVSIGSSNGFANHNTAVSSDLGIVPWSARQFRVILHIPGTRLAAWGSTWFPVDGEVGVVAQFTYQSV